MKRFELYNLYLGEEPPDRQYSACQIGPFLVELTEDYRDRVKLLPRNRTVRIFPPFDQNGKSVQRKRKYRDGQEGEWVCTATASIDDGQSGEESVLSTLPIDDHGIWDLCEILTFLTGRRVTTPDQLKRYPLRPPMNNACIPMETLWAIALAWTSRHDLVRSNLEVAFDLHNGSKEQPVLQCAAALNSMSLNAILDSLSLQRRKISNGTKKLLREEVCRSVEECQGSELGPELKEVYKRLLCARINEGPSTTKERLVQLLLSIGVVDSTSASEPVVLKRVDFVNATRNHLVHRGRAPDLRGLSKEQSERYMIAISIGVVHQICQTFFGKQFGFTDRTAGSLSQHPDDLKDFFLNGKWRGWPIEEMAFTEWFEGR